MGSEVLEVIDRLVPWFITIGVLLMGGVIAFRRVGGQAEDQVPQRFLQLIDAQNEQLAKRDARITALEVEMRINRQWTAMLSAQVVALGGNPVTEFDAASALGIPVPGGPVAGKPSGPVVDTVKLAQILGSAFNLGELASLAFDLGVDLEQVAPNAGLQRQAQELVALMRRTGRLKDLEQAVRSARPAKFE